jgi:serine/threonine protein kinase
VPIDEDSAVQGHEELFAGDVLARKYRLIRPLGQGSMATVWVAENIALEVEIAVKILHTSLITDPRMVARFRREARATAAIGHKNIVQVFDYGVTSQGAPFIVMELLKGQTLAQRIKDRGKLTPIEAVHILARAMKGITVAHAKGVIHRDLKPENIFLAIEDNGAERPKVLDFGVSFMLQDGGAHQITQTGVIIGTPAYMPPEAVGEGKKVDARGDIWALGVMLYEIITGELPFEANSYHKIIESIVHEHHIPISARVPTIDKALERIIDKALEKRPEDRHPGVREFFDELNDWLFQHEGEIRPSVSRHALPADPHSDAEEPTFVGPSVDNNKPPSMRPARISDLPVLSEPATMTTLVGSDALQVKVKIRKPKSASPLLPLLIGAILAILVLIVFVWFEHKQQRSTPGQRPSAQSLRKLV